ncbi:MAG: hypothetical protein M3281_03150 [Chloroflexota bacterium]|nr:hypothetical protein [Chloroflexota bacterium]
MQSKERVTVSFVVRLTKEPRELEMVDAGDQWRGLVQHVQSGEELRFARMEQLYAFIEKYMSSPSSG